MRPSVVVREADEARAEIGRENQLRERSRAVGQRVAREDRRTFRPGDVYQRTKPQKGITYFVEGSSGKLRKGDVHPTAINAAAFDQDQTFMLVEIDGKLAGAIGAAYVVMGGYNHSRITFAPSEWTVFTRSPETARWAAYDGSSQLSVG